MWPSNSIKRSPLKIIRCYSQLLWHKSTEMLNLACVVPAHRGCLFCAWALAYSIRLRFPLRLRLPYALIMKLRCKTESQQSKQKQALSCVCVCNQATSRPYLPGENLLFTGDKKNRSTTPHICFYISTKLSDKVKQDGTLLVRRGVKTSGSEIF